jgi:hypothetical protein
MEKPESEMLAGFLFIDLAPLPDSMLKVDNVNYITPPGLLLT